MARKKLTDEEKRRKELIKELLRETPLRNGQDFERHHERVHSGNGQWQP